MKRLSRGIVLGAIAALLIVMPAVAAYYAYITVEEEAGVSYTNLPLSVTRNITQLIEYDIVSVTGLDTRVFTGDIVALEHMMANDRIMFVTDLTAYEEKTLIFYTDYTSLSAFPIIVGYGGYITTLDDADLELEWVLEVLVDGYFDASSGSDKNILYKEDAFKMSISAANTLKVQGLEAGDVEQWDLTYSSFTSGEHTVYVMSNGLAAYLYVDDFVIAKDTANFYDSTSQTIDNDGQAFTPSKDKTFYADGRYWAFYHEGSSDDYIRWRTSTDGDSWSGEQTVAIYIAAVSIQPNGGFSVWFDGTYCHIAYGDYDSSTENFRYRRGDPQSGGTISWSAAWQTASGGARAYIRDMHIVADSSGYPMIAYWNAMVGGDYAKIVKSSTNDGTWSTAGGYPLEYYLYRSCALMVEPNGDEMYFLARLEADEDVLYGKRYNGSTWAGTWTTVEPDAYGAIYNTGTDIIGDDDGNWYLLWYTYVDSDWREVHMRILYDNDTFSSIIDIAGGNADEARDISGSYNIDNDVVYLFYGHDDYVKCRTIYDSDTGKTLSAEYTLFGHDISYGQGSTPYSDHIGILVGESGGAVAHGTLDLTAYAWNDNANNWTWMQNNCMSWADEIVMAVDGIIHLDYEPITMIQNAVLPDKSGASGNDGTITWGTNPSVTTDISVVYSDATEPPDPDIVNPELTPSGDMVGPTGQQGWTRDPAALTTHPLYPLIYVFSDLWNIPIGLAWIIFATFWVIVAMVLATKYAPHQIFVALVGGGLTAFFYAMGIYPFWVMFIFAIMAIAIIVGERSPTVS